MQLLGKEGEWERRAVCSAPLPPGRSCSCFRWRWGESHGCHTTVLMPSSTLPLSRAGKRQSILADALGERCSLLGMSRCRAGARECLTENHLLSLQCIPWALVPEAALGLGGRMAGAAWGYQVIEKLKRQKQCDLWLYNLLVHIQSYLGKFFL